MGFAAVYARSLKNRPHRSPQDGRSSAGEGVGQGSREPARLVAALVPEERDYFEERAAMREFDGGFPRDEAERQAWGDLEAARKRGGV